MTITVEAADRIVSLSQGLPHYVHRLTQQAGLAAAEREDIEVNSDDVDAAIKIVVTDTQESAAKDYHAATYSTRPDALFEDVLLACAGAPPTTVDISRRRRSRVHYRRSWASHIRCPLSRDTLRPFVQMSDIRS